MAKNYGIGFCKEGLAILQEEEDKLFEKFNHGFDMHSEEYRAELKYKRMLKTFQREKDLGLPPSYDKNIHGSLTA
jgi:hypothetical protein